MNRPPEISLADWKILQLKYKQKPKYLLKKLSQNYPIQYLIGNVEFFHTVIKVKKKVFIPRLETELLMEKVTNFIKKKGLKELKILDICTGSGCIAISLAKYFNLEATALDISSQALKLAKQNARKNQVKLVLKKRNILKANVPGKFNLVVCNPPYVAQKEIVDSKTFYEPQAALYANNNGLEFYETILPKIKDNLEATFFLAFEIGEKQGEYLLKLAKKYYFFAKIWLEKDYNHKERYLFITNL